MSKPGPKKRKIIYRDTPGAKAAELEEFLFGAQGDAGQVLSRRGGDSEDDDQTLTELLGAGQLFFEDKARHPAAHVPITDSSDEEDGDDSSSTSSSDDGERSSEEAASEPQSGHGALTGDADRTDTARSDAEAGASSSSSSSSDDDHDEGAAAGTPGRAAGAAPAARVPVWEDPADKRLSVSLTDQARLRKLRKSHGQRSVDGSTYEAALRQQHAALNPNTAWAAARGKRRLGDGSTADKELRADEGDDGDDGLAGLLVQAGGLLAGRPARLQPGTLETTRLKDANAADPTKAVVRSVSWHPRGQLLLTAGLDKKLRLFQVDGADNPLIQGVYLQDCPVQNAAWAAEGSQIVATGRRPFFYVFDVGASRVERVQPHLGGLQLKSLESFAASTTASSPASHMAAFCGDQGYVPLVSLHSRQWIANVKMNGTARCLAWAPGGNELLTLGSEGVVYTWDMRMRRCVSQLRDHANVRPTALAVSPDGRYIATGSESGVVNVYSRGGAGGGVGVASGGASVRTPCLGAAVESRLPLKEALNLTTAVDSLAFSHDSHMLAFASRMKRDAMRVMHMASCTVFSNWPSSRSPLHYVHSVAFSPHSGFLTVGNARGRALLYRLHHYQEA